MMLNLNHLIGKIKNTIHVGAYVGEEISFYESAGVQSVIFFEPQKEVFNRLIDNVKKSNISCMCINCALGSANQIVDLKISRHINDKNLRASSSLLSPKLHLQQHPDIYFSEKEQVQVITLDYFLQQVNINISDFNFMNIDVQGYELEVLKGAVSILPQIKYILCEVNNDYTYENCALVEEIDNFLSTFNFIRTQTSWFGTWGDALYENTINSI